MNLKILSWVAFGFSFIGVILNANKLIISWIVWSVGNLIWIYWSFKKKEWSQLILWIVFTIGNIYGLIKWLKI